MQGAYKNRKEYLNKAVAEAEYHWTDSVELTQLHPKKTKIAGPSFSLRGIVGADRAIARESTGGLGSS